MRPTPTEREIERKGPQKKRRKVRNGVDTLELDRLEAPAGCFVQLRSEPAAG